MNRWADRLFWNGALPLAALAGAGVVAWLFATEAVKYGTPFVSGAFHLFTLYVSLESAGRIFIRAFKYWGEE